MIELIKAVVFEHPGDVTVLKWTDVPFPKPSASNQVLLRVKAAGVNRPDILQRQGSYQPPTDASSILGLEVSGIVEQVYGESRLKYGDRVCALTHGGGYAEYVWVDERHCLPIPEGWSFEEVASIPETYFTVWFNLFQEAGLSLLYDKKNVLIHAGASGIGVAAIQLCKAFGHHVVTTVRREDQVSLCNQIGADEVLLLDQDWADELRSRKIKIDYLLDMLGRSTIESNLSVLNKNAHLIWIAFLTGDKVQVPISAVMAKQIKLTGSFLRPQSDEVKAKIAKDLFSNVWPLLESGAIKPVIQHVFPINEVQQAHALMEKGGHFGKIVLRIENT